jgi:hypothetical protein
VGAPVGLVFNRGARLSPAAASSAQASGRRRFSQNAGRRNGTAREQDMSHQWVKCTAHSDAETVYVNLAHASMIKAHNTGARITLATADEQWFEVQESPAEIVDRLGRPQNDERR